MTADWRAMLSPYIEGRRSVCLYATDPGAVGMLTPVAEWLADKNIECRWHYDGWAADQKTLPPGAKGEDLARSLNPDALLLMGQQVDFNRSHARLRAAKEVGATVFFFSDHWEDISATFSPAGEAMVLPDIIFVPDAVALTTQSEGLRRKGAPADRIKIFGQPGLERSLERLHTEHAAQAPAVAAKYGLAGRRLILAVLDPFRPDQPENRWQDILENMVRTLKPGQTLIVKPHPRQDAAEVAGFIAGFGNPAIVMISDEKPETLMVLADEVWGMRSFVLMLAVRAGKTVRQFRPHGERQDFPASEDQDDAAARLFKPLK